MKIRQDFVTNSSSSSFVLTIKGDAYSITEGLVDETILLGQGWIKTFIEQEESTIEEAHKDIQAYKKDILCSDFYKTIFIHNCKRRIKSCEASIAEAKRIKECWHKNPKRNLIAFVRLQMKTKNLTYKVSNDINGQFIDIAGRVPMWNGVGDMPDVLSHIITYLATARAHDTAWTFTNTMDSY